VLATSDQPLGGRAQCRPAYRWLRIAPPGQSRAVTISAWIPHVGGLPACSAILVSPVIPASGLPYLAEHHV
jgi:hypothetical protein